MRREERSASSHPARIEPLEGRRLLSGGAITGGHLAAIGGPVKQTDGVTVVPFAHRAPAPTVATTTALGISTNASILGQPVTLTAKVGAASGAAGGTVTFYAGRRTVIGSATIGSRGRASTVIYNLYKGNYSIRAVYAGDSTFLSSQSPNVSLVTTQGTMSTAGDGLQSATVVAGSGPAITTLQNAALNYTGYLDDGTKFDSSLNPGRTPFTFQVGAHQVIQGFDEGVLGMKVGEIRVLIIPASLGYGSTGQGNIPPFATLTFILQLLSIS